MAVKHTVGWLMLPPDFTGVVDLSADNVQTWLPREFHARYTTLIRFEDGESMPVVLLEMRLTALKDPEMLFDVSVLLTVDDVAGLSRVLATALLDLTLNVPPPDET